MRCKKHLSDFSSTIGVCASCLRERLFVVVESQSQSKSVPDNSKPNPIQLHNHRFYQQQQPPPPPLIFPRSVSPYISRRKSDLTASATTTTTTTTSIKKLPMIQRFYSTPQVGPTFQKKKSSGKFGLISKLFRSKSSVASSTTNSEVGPTEFVRCSNRGMSPQNEWEELEEREREAMTRPSPGRVKASPARLANNVANFAFCLSPLVRASPASRHHWGIEPSFSGEIRVPTTGKSNFGSCNKSNNSNNDKPHLSEAASFCANRSRKLADFGRLNRNR
ncbi:uncharacterized protein [Spinacia oleracea]|uniref:DUF4005 domain-containing protein n=1 Tax=Spinacia oleracea TaxID=3562 RepID=A0ABM3RCF8_SPIOL|nr:uncharacterized protein LOC110777830 [Spinacia oleracea]